MFTTPSLEDRELEVAKALEAAMDGLRGSLERAAPWQDRFNRYALARVIQAWGSLEHVEASLDQVATILDGVGPQGISDRDADLLRGARDAIEFAGLPSTEDLARSGPAMLRALHFMVLRHEPDANPGVLRSERAISVGDALELEDLSTRVGEVFNELQETGADSLPSIRAGMVHLNLIAIRPFTAGNAPLARVVQAHILARSWLLQPWLVGLEEYLGPNSRRYFEILQVVGTGPRSDTEGLHRWIRFILTGHLRFALIWEVRASEAERLWRAIEETAARNRIDTRMISSLYDAAMGLTVRRAHHIASTGVSERVASADLKKLSDMGWLRAVGDKRGRVYVASDKLRSTRVKTRLKRPPPVDPFD